ncbi:MAG: N-6 DNA methylase [Promethearchaeota archaeon]
MSKSVNEILDINSFFDDSSLLNDFIKKVYSLEKSNKDFKKKFERGFETWKTFFNTLYDGSRLDEELYLKHGYLFLLSTYIMEKAFNLSLYSIENDYFQEFLACFEWINSDLVLNAMKEKVPSRCKVESDIFNKIYPKLIPHSTKHGSGEYYTPWPLALLMVEKKYKFGKIVIDPSCGSGTFICALLNEIIKQEHDEALVKEAVLNVVGIDKNPLAVFMTTINVIMILRSHGINDIISKVYRSDSLFPEACLQDDLNRLRGQVDLIIGNPPWIVLGAIENTPYKTFLKELAKKLNIYIGGKNTSNLEIAILFLYKFREYMRPEGWIFFILPNSIITASQHEKARVFRGFDDIVVWEFNHQPFRINSICLMVRKSKNNKSNPMYKGVPFYPVQIDNKSAKFILNSSNPIIHEPIHVERSKSDNSIISVKRLVPSSSIRKLLKIGESPYKKMFYKGAQVFPRMMLFVDIIKETVINGSNLVQIRPSKLVVAKKLGRWQFKPYNEAMIEKQYIFPVVKSTFLVPFRIMRFLNAFLPFVKVEKENKAFLKHAITLAPLASKHYNTLQSIFIKNKKPGAAHESLVEIINFQNCLSNPRQMQTMKIVYNGGGSVVKGALVRGEAIVDYSMFYYPPKNENEAYYLLAYLNSNVLTESVKLVGSTGYNGSLRNVVKHPWNFKWPLFNEKDQSHLKLANLGKILEKIVDEHFKSKYNHLMNKNPSSNLKNFSRLKIQNEIFALKNANRYLHDVDDLVVEIIKNS